MLDWIFPRLAGRFFRLCWVVALSFLSLPLLAEGCVKTVRWSTGHDPYAFKDESGAVRGLHMDLVREALRRMQCETQFVEMPWARALRELQTGRLDILPAAANTEERKAFALFSRPTNSARNILFVRRESEKKYRLGKLSDLMGTDFRLAVRRGASYGDEYDALLNQPQFLSRLTYVSSSTSGLQMMGAGRVEGLLADEMTGILGVQKMGLGQSVRPSELVTASDADFVAFSKATTDTVFVQNFNHALGAMMADGTYKKLLETYLPCPVSVEKLGCR
jgi:polar amino acid transport system substrate-binding protein